MSEEVEKRNIATSALLQEEVTLHEAHVREWVLRTQGAVGSWDDERLDRFFGAPPGHGGGAVGHAQAKRDADDYQAALELVWHAGLRAWLAHKAVTPAQAAMLLCGFDPNDCELEDAKRYSNQEVGPNELTALLSSFEDLQRAEGAEPANRMLVDWAAFAEVCELKVHSWFGEYAGALPDHKRRLYLLRHLGGTARRRRGGWSFTGFNALVSHERQAKRPRSSEKTIRDDLRQAAEEEAVAKRAGSEPGAAPSGFQGWGKSGR